MSITSLTCSVLLLGFVTFMFLKRLVAPVRVVAACVLMVSLETLTLIVKNPRTAAPSTNSSPASSLPVSSAQVALIGPNLTGDTGPAGELPLHRTSEEDHNFLDEVLEKQNRDLKTVPTGVRKISKAGVIGSAKERLLKAELAVNTAGAERSEPVMHKETVKRAQLVTHAETLKHVEPFRTRQQ